MLGSPFLRRFLQDHAAGRNSIIAHPVSKPASVRSAVANSDLTHLLLNSSFQMFYAFLPTRGGPRIFSSVSASTLILCERRGRGTSEHRACAGTPNNRDSVRFPAQANSTVHSCLLHDHGTRTRCCFSKVVLGPNGNIVRC